MQNPYLEGQGDLVSRLIVRRTRVIVWVIRALAYLLSPLKVFLDGMVEPPRGGRFHVPVHSCVIEMS